MWIFEWINEEHPLVPIVLAIMFSVLAVIIVIAS